MKRLLIFAYFACCVLHAAWGQESSANVSQSPFIGEWRGTFRNLVYWKNEYKNTDLILRIESFGNELGVRVKKYHLMVRT